MKKTILNIGSALKKSEQQEIQGGMPFSKPSQCCDPSLGCCTTTDLAVFNPACGATYIPGCQFHPATNCCI